MPNDFGLVPGALCDLHIIVADGDRRIANDLKDLQLVHITPGEIRIGEPLRFELAFRKNLRPIRFMFADPLNSMVRVKDQLPGHFSPFIERCGDTTVRRLALKLAETIKVVPEMCNFRAEDKRDYGVISIAKVSEEKEIRGVHIPKRGDTESKLETKLVTAKRFYFRNRWYGNTDGEELSFRCSSYEALLGKDLGEMLEDPPYKAIVRMVLPKSTGSPLGAVLVEFIKNK